MEETQGDLWRLAGEAIARDPQGTAPRLYAETLNETIDTHTERVSSLKNRVPAPVLYLLVFGSAVALGRAVGSHGTARTRRRYGAGRGIGARAHPVRVVRPRPTQSWIDRGAVHAPRERGRNDERAARRRRLTGIAVHRAAEVAAASLASERLAVDLANPELGEKTLVQLGETGTAERPWSRQVDPVVERDAAVGEHDDAVREDDRLVDVVRDEQHRRLVHGAEVPDQLTHLDAGQRVERGERLVEQEQLWLSHQGPGERDPLRLPARERRRPCLLPLAQPDLVERGTRRGTRSAPPFWPTTTLRHTFCDGTSRGSWKTTVRAGGTHTAPSSAGSRPARMRSSVVLPLPLAPRSATNSPERISRSTPSSTGRANDLWTPRICTARRRSTSG